MALVRLLQVTYPSARADEVAQKWKEEYGPLLKGQAGCLSETLLQCKDVPNEFVSYSEWQDEDSIRDYLGSNAYQTIRNHHLRMGGGKVGIRLYIPV